jgi:transporter family-2 protein
MKGRSFMTGSALLVSMPIVVGISIVIQAVFMAQMDRRMGTLESVFITYGVGFLIIALVLLSRRGGNLLDGVGLPWYVFTAGFFGLLIIGGISFSASRVGLVSTFVIVVATQFVCSSLVDHFGLFGQTVRVLDFARVTGIGMLWGGVWLILR